MSVIKANLINFICGIAIGAGAILPGISGGVLCVVFGIYKDVMELFANPIKGIRTKWKMFLPIGIGWLVGFFAFANLIKLIFGTNEIYATWLFIGLILGEIPSLYKEAGEKGRDGKSYAGMILGFLVMFSILMTFKFLPSIQVSLNMFWYAFAGVLWGLSLVIPGMGSTAILMSLGIFESFNNGLAEFKLGVIIPWVLGMAVTVILLSKLMTMLFDKYYSVMYHIVIGITIASTLAIVPLTLDYRLSDILISASMFIFGAILAVISAKLKVEK